MPADERPPPRRRSCSACIKAKRRCDLRRPICSRCAGKNLACDYGEAQSYPPSTDLSRNDELDTDTISFGGPSRSLSSTPLPPFGSPYMSLDQGEVHQLPYRDSSGVESRAFWQQQLGPGSFSPGWATNVTASGSAGAIYASEGVSQLSLSDSFAFNAPMAPVSRVVHSVAWMRKIPGIYARMNETPFMHPALYKLSMPHSVFNAFVTCSVYSNKTPANQSLVYRILEESVSDLLVEDTVTSNSNPYETLARTQSLLLYQIMRAFDGDTTLRAQAEGVMTVLENWTSTLRRIRNTSEEIQIPPPGASVILQIPQSWESWIFHESVRRTIVMVYYFITIFNIIRNSEARQDIDQILLHQVDSRTTTPDSPWAVAHPWTLSRDLWQAPSSFDFFTGWREKPHFTISNLFFEDYLKTGTGSDADEFGQLFLSTCAGLKRPKR